jgi:amino acid transporter/nucleotide-binding universal stress UspA family protein
MTDSSHQQELARDMGFLEAYTMGVGTMIGAGIFVLPSIAAANAGPASMISFLIGGVVSLLAALSLSELATGMPRSGGSYYYVNHSLGSFFGSIVGVGMWAGLMFATAFYMLGFGQYMTYFFGDLPVQYAALVMAALLVGINYRGVKEASFLQNFIVIGLIGLILVFVSVGVVEVDMGTLDPFNPGGWIAVVSLSATLYVSFIGFEVIATSAEEIEDPGRNLPLAMLASVLTPMLLYVLVMFVSTGILPVSEIATSDIPVADVAAEYLGDVGTLAMVVGAVLATVSSANASILSAARVNFAMGRDQILPNWLNEVHEHFQTPYRAIVVTGLVILVMIGIGVGIETLADVASFAYLVTYALVHLAVIVMRWADPPDYDPEFRLPSWVRPFGWIPIGPYPLVPILGLVSTVAILTQMRSLVLSIGVGLLGLGSLWFVFFARTRAEKVSMLGEAISAVSAESVQKTGYRVVVPVANPKTEDRLLRLAAACARDHEQPELIVVNAVEVPMQTALSQDVAFEEERVRRQKVLLDVASQAATELGVRLRTRAIVARNASEAILDVVRDEEADRLMMGWSGQRRRREYVFGSTVDTVVQNSPCEVSLMNVKQDDVGDVVALVGRGPISPLTARQAREIAESESASSLTLLNVQSTDVDDPRKTGREIVEEVAASGDVPPDQYDVRIEVTDDEIVDALVAAGNEYGTICIGASREGAFKQALFGSIPEEVGERVEGNVIMVNRPFQPRTVWEALFE